METPPHNIESQQGKESHADTDHRMWRLIRNFLRIYENPEITSADSVIEYKQTYPQVVQYAEDIAAQRLRQSDED